jgi:hypothetical protein
VKEDFAEFVKYFKSTQPSHFDDMEEESEEDNALVENDLQMDESAGESSSEDVGVGSDAPSEDDSEDEEIMTLVDEFDPELREKKIEIIPEVPQEPQPESTPGPKSSSSDDACGW